jgi:cytidylate kinase
MYAPRGEKLRRIRDLGKTLHDAEDLVDSVDRERVLFVKHYFGADWPTRSLYHLMINTSMGNETVLSTILQTMRMMEPVGVR